ncbi:MAG TPA: allantoicase [Bacteroidota bacterium]|nr:allantoicase [Bacteroidota bacterium]
MDPANTSVAFEGLIDLISERIGGKTIAASDDFFAPKENLLKRGRGEFLPGKYTDRGKWMDGWETRRRRGPGHDWCIIELGVKGSIHGVDIDTNHFLGNHPMYASVDACHLQGSAATRKLQESSNSWTEILPRSPLKPGAQNLFPVGGRDRWTHLRLNIYPDGGVARFRAYGVALPDWDSVSRTALIDLAAVVNGGTVPAASDMFFGSKENLIMPGRSESMSDGWETRRRRGPGHDWAIIRLGHSGLIRKIEVDTNHFKGNSPERCSLEICHEPAGGVDALSSPDIRWKELLPETKLSPHKRHVFAQQLRKPSPATHVRLNIFPDGGVSRLRIWGTLA